MNGIKKAAVAVQTSQKARRCRIFQAVYIHCRICSLCAIADRTNIEMVLIYPKRVSFLKQICSVVYECDGTWKRTHVHYLKCIGRNVIAGYVTEIFISLNFSPIAMWFSTHKSSYYRVVRVAYVNKISTVAATYDRIFFVLLRLVPAPASCISPSNVAMISRVIIRI